MKKTLALALAMMMVAAMTLTGCGSSEERVVNVCSWGEYIDENLIYQFEEETGIKVNYQTAESNEALYSLLKTGAGDYDVIVPSDYMIARLIAEDMLAELDYSSIPNYEKIDAQYAFPFASRIIAAALLPSEVVTVTTEGASLPTTLGVKSAADTDAAMQAETSSAAIKAVSLLIFMLTHSFHV